METKTKKAILDVIKERNDYLNNGLCGHYKASRISYDILWNEKIKLENKSNYFYEILQNGEAIGKVKIRYSQKQIACSHPILTPKTSDIVLY